MTGAGGKIRLDKWLWQARFFKTRSLATQVCRSGKVRLNGEHVAKASAVVKPGDVIVFPKETDLRVIELLACGTRRGPAEEARSLYTDLTPPEEKTSIQDKNLPPAHRDRGAGRPTKTQRRAIDKLMDRN